jgi:RNA polymerase sigma-70 factor, ECF subfamily
VAQDIGHHLIAILPRLRRFALSLARKPDLADDLVQISCEKALANAASWTEGTRFDAWMFRILRNTWIDQTRRRKTEGATEDVYTREDLVGVRGDTAVENLLTLQKVWEAIGNLPHEHREILVLVCVEGLTYKEAADVLNLPVGTVMSRLARARMKIMALSGIDD